jgi:transposase-like protein
MTIALRSDYDAFRIETESRTWSGRRARIAKALASLYRGEALDSVAATAGVMIGTLRRWADAFTTEGFEGVFALSIGQVYELRKDYDAQTLRLAAETALYPGQKVRLLAIASMYDGLSTKEIVRMTRVSASALSQWRSDFNRRGLEHEYQVPDNRLQANFKASNRLYPLSRVLKVRRKATTPDMIAKLDAIIMSYRDRSVEAISQETGASKALVASWIKAFNAAGPSALDVEGSSFSGRTIPKFNLDLPEEYSAESLREAASRQTDERFKLRLFALASMYETNSIKLAASFHKVTREQLSAWKRQLSLEGIEGVLRDRQITSRTVLSEEEIEDAVALAPSKREGKIIRAAAAVASGMPISEAVARWIVPIPTVKKLADKIKRLGAAALETDDVRPFLLPLSTGNIRRLAGYAPEPDRSVLLALAAISSGKRLKDVLSETVTRRELLRCVRSVKENIEESALLASAAEDKQVVEATQAAVEAAQPDPPVEPCEREETTRYAPFPPKNAPTHYDRMQAALQKLRIDFQRWKRGNQNHFAISVMDRIETLYGQPGTLNERLRKDGIQRSLFDKWEERALKSGIDYLRKICVEGHVVKQPERIPLWEQEIHDETEFRKKRRMAGVFAFLTGASATEAAAIAGMDAAHIEGFARVITKFGSSLSGLPYTTGLPETLREAKIRAAKEKRERKASYEKWLRDRQAAAAEKRKADQEKRAEESLPYVLSDRDIRMLQRLAKATEAKRNAQDIGAPSAVSAPTATVVASAEPATEPEATAKEGPSVKPEVNLGTGVQLRADYDAAKFSELLKAATKPASVRKFKAMILAYNGHSPQKIATSEGIPVAKTEKWIADFNRGGIIALMQS